MAKSKSNTSAAKKRPDAHHPQGHKSDSAPTTHGKAVKKVAEKPNVGYTVHDQHKKIRDAFPELVAGSIDSRTTVGVQGKSVGERLTLLDLYAEEHPGVAVSDYVRRVFPEITAIEHLRMERALPLEQARGLWNKDRLPGETPPAFVQRFYSDLLAANNLTLGDLGRVDPPFVRVVYNWKRSHPWPDDVQLLTDRERNDQAVTILSTLLGLSELDGDQSRIFGHVARLAWAAKEREVKRSK